MSELSANIIQRHNKRSLSDLRRLAKEHFHKFIRMRDEIHPGYFRCLTCGRTKRIQGKDYQACHLFPAGSFPWIEFHPDNVHGGCLQCNYYKHGDGANYATIVRRLIGEQRWKNLVFLKEAGQKTHERGTYKHDRFRLIEIIEHYKRENRNGQGSYHNK